MKRSYLPRITRVQASWMAFSVAAVIISASFVSCSSLQRTVHIPPSIPGATFVGSGECAQCHEEITRDFAWADHARLQAKGPNAIQAGCESCHGPGSLHSQVGGGRQNIINPGRSPEAGSRSSRFLRHPIARSYWHPTQPRSRRR